MEGRPRMRTWSIQNGTTPTHAVPSKVSTVNDSGNKWVSSVAGIGQCANSRSFQRWVMTHGDFGKGHGRCSVVERILFMPKGHSATGVGRRASAENNPHGTRSFWQGCNSAVPARDYGDASTNSASFGFSIPAWPP